MSSFIEKHDGRNGTGGTQMHSCVWVTMLGSAGLQATPSHLILLFLTLGTAGLTGAARSFIPSFLHSTNISIVENLPWSRLF